MTIWRGIFEGVVLAAMIMVTLAAGAFLKIAMQPDIRVEAAMKDVLAQDCVATFKAMKGKP